MPTSARPSRPCWPQLSEANVSYCQFFVSRMMIRYRPKPLTRLMDCEASCPDRDLNPGTCWNVVLSISWPNSSLSAIYADLEDMPQNYCASLVLKVQKILAQDRLISTRAFVIDPIIVAPHSTKRRPFETTSSSSFGPQLRVALSKFIQFQPNQELWITQHTYVKPYQLLIYWYEVYLMLSEVFISRRSSRSWNSAIRRDCKFRRINMTTFEVFTFVVS